MEFPKRYERTKLYDLAAALPLFGYYGWLLWSDWPELVRNYRIVRFGYSDTAFVGNALAQFLSFVFIAVLIVLLLARTVPTGKSGGLLPRAVAVLGAFLSVAFLQLPPAQLSATLALASIFIVVSGLVLMIVALTWLGRSFSIMPEARRLVTSGPYKLVRHPLYLFEEIAIFGIMLQYVQPWSFLLFAAQFSMQMARTYFEEKVLAANFPDYAAYRARTDRLIPGVF